MALKQITVRYEGKPLDYTLESGIRVEYPPTEVGYYLVCLFRSLYEHDKLLRRMLVGLAAKNIRKAMEIFLDFCKSGHIGSKEFLQIRARQGDYVLPYKVVMRVLLRLNRRYYDGDESHVKNLFQCDPDDAHPNHFVRLAILRWLEDRFRRKGPSGVKAFHRVERMIADLGPFGHDAERIRTELRYLVKAMCVLTEHQRTDTIADEDLICLSPAGFVHLSIVDNIDYLAACAEDCWVADSAMAQRMADRIGQFGIHVHYARETMRSNAADFVSYLAQEAQRQFVNPKGFLEDVSSDVRERIEEIMQKVVSRVAEERARDGWTNVTGKFTVGNKYWGTISEVREYGVFVKLDGGPRGLFHQSKMAPNRSPSSYKAGDRVEVRVLVINVDERKIALGTT